MSAPSAFLYDCGDRAKDRITGLEGIIVSRAQHLYGCNRYWLQPEGHKDGKPLDGGWFDEFALEVLQPAVHARVDPPPAQPAHARERTGGFDVPDSRASGR